MPYKSPKNPQEYWSIVNTYWDSVFHILNVYLPTFQKKWIDGTTLDAELADYLLSLKDKQDTKLIRAFHAALWNCPEENSGEWMHKDWNVFYDLCLSECYVMEPLEETYG